MRHVACFAVFVLAACGASGPGEDASDNEEQQQGDQDEADEDEPERLDPVLSPVSWPAVLRAGDELTVTGAHFFEPDRGSVVVRFVGAFSTDMLGWYDVDARIVATSISNTRAKITFEPAYPPDGFGRELGFFEGRVHVINVDHQGNEWASVPVEVDLEAGRSIVVHRIRPVGQECATHLMTKMPAGQAIELDIEVLGFAVVSEAKPIDVELDWTEYGTGVMQALTTNRGWVTVLAPGFWDDEEGTLFITAEADQIDHVERTIVFEALNEHEVSYDGAVTVSERFAPVRVTNCLSPGTHNYSESANEGRTRGVSFTGDVTVPNALLDEAFGFDVDGTVSSGSGLGLGVAATVAAGSYGAFFRQALRLGRSAPVVTFSACGEAQVVGSVLVTDWAWVPGFNQQGGACPPYPEPIVSPAGELQMP
ncbi:MAG: hypothetical protein ACAI38_11115 [Myxococcota bacterium]